MHYQRSSIATRSSVLNSASNSGINSYWIVSQPVSGTSETSSEICAVTLHAPTSRVSFRVNHRRDLTLFRYTSDKLSRCINCQHHAKRSFPSVTYATLRDIPCRYIILYITILRYNTVSCLFFIVAPVCIRKNGYLFFFYSYKPDGFVRIHRIYFSLSNGAVPFNFPLCSRCTVFSLDLTYFTFTFERSICQNLLRRSLIADYKHSRRS